MEVSASSSHFSPPSPPERAPACAGCCSSSGPATDAALPADRPRDRARAARLLSPTRLQGPWSTSSARRRGRLLGDRMPDRMAEKYYPDYAPGAAAAEGQRQDRRPALRRGALDHQRLGRGRGPALGADAVGYTPTSACRARTPTCISSRVREDCDRYGMPLVIWAYPRGTYVEKKGGQKSLYAIDGAARLAMEMGADVVVQPAQSRAAPTRRRALQRASRSPRRRPSSMWSARRGARWSCSRAARGSTTTTCSPRRATSWRWAARA